MYVLVHNVLGLPAVHTKQSIIRPKLVASEFETLK